MRNFYNLGAKVLAKELEELGCFDKQHDDRSYYYFYFPPNKNNASYGVKVNKSTGEVSAVMYVAMWDVDIEFEDLFSNLSEESAEILIFNLDVFSGKTVNL